MKILKTLLFAFAILTSYLSFSQKLSNSEIDSVQLKIYRFIEQNESRLYDSARFEVLLVIIETDSASKIIDLHLLIDEKNKDVAYRILSKMTPADFKGWHPKQLPNGTITVPIYTVGSKILKGTAYVNKSFWEMAYEGIGGRIIKQENNAIVLNGIHYEPMLSVGSH